MYPTLITKFSSKHISWQKWRILTMRVSLCQGLTDIKLNMFKLLIIKSCQYKTIIIEIFDYL